MTAWICECTDPKANSVAHFKWWVVWYMIYIIDKAVKIIVPQQTWLKRENILNFQGPKKRGQNTQAASFS